MKKYLLTLSVFLICNTHTYASAYPANLEGIYDCNSIEVGTNENFKGVMTLKRTGQTYSIKSTFNDGSSYIGTGIYNQLKHSFSLVFVNPSKSEETGIAVADVKRNYAMTSTWTYLNKEIVAHSTCTKRTV